MTYTGGCSCGAVRYSIDAEPKFVAKCYCGHCKRESGTGHITVAAFAEGALRIIAGEPAVFKRAEGPESKVERTFCDKCGSTLFSQFAVPGHLNVRVGALDDNTHLKPTVAIFTAFAAPWDQPPPGMQQFSHAPTGG